MGLNLLGGRVQHLLLILAAAVLSSVFAQTAEAQGGAQGPVQGPAGQAQISPENDLGNILFSDQPAPIIQGIAVTGNQRIEAETVGSYLPINA